IDATDQAPADHILLSTERFGPLNGRRHPARDWMPSSSASCWRGLHSNSSYAEPLLLQAPEGGGGAVTVFYRGRRALITQQVFEAVCVGRRQYAIRDLTDVHIVRLDPASGPGVR